MGPRIAIVGCGAVAGAHLPIVGESEATVTVLVDRDLDRAREMADAHDVEHAVADWNEVRGLADAAIVALPHHLHAPASVDLLGQGVHVLVEKPMGMDLAECDRMNATADASGAVLAVGLVSRWFGIARYVKEVIDRGLLGPIRSFDVREGMVYSWPVASDFMFRREAGGGVLADTGAHVLDLLLYWLGDAQEVRYRDDARGGAEADCELELVMDSGAKGLVQMSRVRDLRNTWILEGERGRLEVMRRFHADFTWTLEGQGNQVAGSIQKDGEPEDPLDCFRLQWRDFLGAIAEGRKPLCDGHEGRRGVELIERCRANAGTLDRSWEAFVR